MTMIVIRCNAGAEDGLGHIKRCLALGHGFANLGWRVQFVVCGGEGQVGASIVSKESTFPVAEVSSQIGTDEDVQALTQWVSKDQQDVVLLIDSKRTSESYLTALRQLVWTVVVDDDADRAMSADALINANIGSHAALYENGSDIGHFLVGPEYNLISAERFDLLPKNAGATILVTMGGEDPEDRSSWIIKTLTDRFEKHRFVVIIGPAHPNPENAQAAAAQAPNIEIVSAPQSLHPYIEMCECAISAGGTTCYELSAARRAFTIILLEDHQHIIADPLIARGAATLAGDVDNWCEETLIDALEKILDPEIALRQMDAQRALFPASGINLTVSAIESIFNSERHTA